MKEKSEFKKIIKLITIFLFRYLTIGEQESKELEKLFSVIAIKIREKIKKANQVREHLRGRNVLDEQFSITLLHKDIKLNKVGTYILKKIEEYYNPSMIEISEKMTLEHILPKTPNDEWKSYMNKNEMDHSQLVHKLGNMTLVLGSVNSKMKNDFFTKKQKCSSTLLG